MFKKIFVVVLSLSMSSIIASQKADQKSTFDFNKIEDVHAYIQNIESELKEDCKGKDSITKNIDTIDESKIIEVYCFCKKNGPLLLTAILSNKETRFTELRIEKNTNGNDINTTETYYTYYDSKNLKSSTKISSYRNDTKNLKYKITEILREEYEDVTTNAKILKKIKIKPKDDYDDIEERYFEYYTDTDKAITVAKELIVVIKGTGKIEDTLYEYDRAGLTTSETKTEYINGLPSKKTVTNYDGTSNKAVIGVVIYEYNEAGLEKFKTVEKYKNGKIISSKYFELIYNSEGKLEKEKPAKKK